MATRRKVFTVRIEGGDAAIEEAPSREVARILRELADAVEGDGFGPGSGGKLFDANGNGVGAWAAQGWRE